MSADVSADGLNHVVFGITICDGTDRNSNVNMSAPCKGLMKYPNLASKAHSRSRAYTAITGRQDAQRGIPSRVT